MDGDGALGHVMTCVNDRILVYLLNNTVDEVL